MYICMYTYSTDYVRTYGDTCVFVSNIIFLCSWCIDRPRDHTDVVDQGAFHKPGNPIFKSSGWFAGYLHFRKPPYVCVYI